MSQHQKPHHSRLLKSYVIGLVLSLIITLAAYILVRNHIGGNPNFSQNFVIFMVFVLAITQLIVQVVCFLHLRDEPKPRWNTMMFAFAIFVVAVLVMGSIWIMYSLDYNMTPRAETDIELIKDEGIHK